MRSTLPILFVAVTLFAITDNSKYLVTMNEVERTQVEAGKVIMREVEPPVPEGQAYEVIGMVQSSGQTLFDILTDYAAYPEFMSAVAGVEILGETGKETTLNYTLTSILGLIKRYRINIRSAELRPGVWKVEWYLVEWPGLRPMETIADTRGHWLIQELDSDLTLLQYYVYSDPGFVPFGLRSVMNALARSGVKNAFIETRGRAQQKITTSSR